jgi:hypothetical protein
MSLRTIASIVIALAMLLIGFAEGYLYTVNSTIPSTQTITTTHTKTVIESRAITATITSFYIVTTESLRTITKTEYVTTMYTTTVIQVKTMVTMVIPRNQIVLRYPFRIFS